MCKTGRLINIKGEIKIQDREVQYWEMQDKETKMQDRQTQTLDREIQMQV
jgi:hypothetical protein